MLFAVQNCHLGQHVPLEKGIGEDGIVLTPSQPNKDGAATSPATPSASKTDDPNTNTRHGEWMGGGRREGRKEGEGRLYIHEFM